MNTSPMMSQTQPTAPTNGNGHAPTSTPAQTTPPAPILEMHEAPYSWNCTAQGPEGFSEMFTVRAVSAEGFYSRVQMLKSNLIDLGYKPAPTRGAPAAAIASEPAPVCAIHKEPMQQRSGKNGQTFWSCPHKLDNGEWCPYRPK